MDPSKWISGFKDLHTRHKAATLGAEDETKYLAMREELARSLVSAQGLSVPEGQNARRSFRVAQVYPLELEGKRSVTRDVSRSGFAAVVPDTFREGERVAFSIVVARGVDPVTGSARVVSSLKQQGSARVSFAIERMAPECSERLEVALFDAVLSRLG